MPAKSAAPTTVWRIAKHTKDFRAEDLSGGGAAAVGGRWNAVGNPVVYAGTSIALCTLETLAHIGDDIACRNRFLVGIEIPHKLWEARQVVAPDSLPKTWVAEPPGMDTVHVGNAWLKSCDSLLLLVPSVIVHEEFNVLINPKHKDADKIKAQVHRPFVYDPRLA
ncbi:MAG: hypothetical protein CFE38_13010 [Comamonadaceae bacterium PBBC1]|jgi:RES domain-containing protein|nr:MAG: hypothetical protein CFE38_13010 [Comamonadaceae bacterium PBBC1]